MRRVLVCIGVFLSGSFLLTVGMLIWHFEYYHLPPISFVSTNADHAILIDQIESYQTVNEFTTRLEQRSMAWNLAEDSPGPRDHRPPFHIVVLEVPEYSHLGVRGRLKVSFLNDRLYATWFYPSDIEGYVRQLESQQGLNLGGRRDTTIRSHVRVWIWEDYNGETYVGWKDIRLGKEVSLWISRYS